VIEEVSERVKGKAKVGKVNVDENQEIAQKFEVSSIPNILILKDGKVVENLTGGMSADDLVGKIEGVL